MKVNVILVSMTLVEAIKREQLRGMNIYCSFLFFVFILR